MAAPKVWVVGNKGMLGRELENVLISAGIPVTGSDADVSILSSSALADFFEAEMPNWIVNCAAYTAVDKAESDAERAFALNRDGAANLAVLAADRGASLVHVSTDYVFDGSSERPLKEYDPVAPQGVYGASKLAGEEAIAGILDRHQIIRTAWLYGIYGSNFVKTMIRLMNEKDEIMVVDDQYGSPTWSGDLATTIRDILMCSANGTCPDDFNNQDSQWGLFHYSGEGDCTWFGFASEIYEQGRRRGLIESECVLVAGRTEDYPTPAKRPEYSLLDKSKIRRVFGVSVPMWKDSLGRYFDAMSRMEDPFSG